MDNSTPDLLLAGSLEILVGNQSSLNPPGSNPISKSKNQVTISLTISNYANDIFFWPVFSCKGPQLGSGALTRNQVRAGTSGILKII